MANARSLLNLQQSASNLASVGSKVVYDGLAQAGGVVSAYAPAAVQKTEEFSTTAIQWVSENGDLVTYAIAGGVIVVVPGLVSAPLLTSLGFTASGVKAASVGAYVHSTIGNVAAGSLFATLQSAGAGGAAALGAVNGAIQTGGAAVAGSSLIGMIKSKF